jgi:hypothetical protein
MDLGALFVVVAIAVLTGAYLAQPMLKHQGFAVSSVGHERSTLQASYEQILAALQELELDYAMGKMSEEDYQAQRKRMLASGAQILRRLDALAGDQGTADRWAGQPSDALEARIEAMVSQRRGKAVFCTQCGSPLGPGDRFCSRCGKPVAEEEKS